MNCSELSNLAVKNVAGDVTGVFEIGRDTGELDKPIGKIRTKRQNPPDSVDTAFSFVGVLTPDGVLTGVTRTALAAAHLESEDVLGKKFADTYWWSFSEAVQTRLRDAVARSAAGESLRFDTVIRTGEGEFITIDFQIAPLIDENGAITHLVPSGTDISERLRLEAALFQTAQMSLAGELAANLAHEIKNPLTGIKGAIDVLSQHQETDGADYSILKNVRNEITRIDDTLRLLLDRVRTRVMRLEQVSLTSTVERIVQLARHHVAAGNFADQIEIVAELPAETFLLPHDAPQIKDAALNLVINAADAIGDRRGRIGIRLFKAETVAAQKYVIEISDTGGGISKENLSNIFTPFFTTKKNGTGLGLAAVKRIAEAHYGYCDVRSTAGQGSTFAIHLPAASPFEVTSFAD